MLFRFKRNKKKEKTIIVISILEPKPLSIINIPKPTNGNGLLNIQIIPYLIIVADAVSVNFSGRCKFFTDLTRKIGYLLCKLAIYCVNFGVNFIFQKFCQSKKNDKYQVWVSP